MNVAIDSRVYSRPGGVIRIERADATAHRMHEVSSALASAREALTAGDTPQALDLIARAEEFDSGNAEASYLAGVEALARSDYVVATACMRRALRAQPGNRDAQVGLAITLTSAGEPREAVLILVRLAREPEASADLWFRLAMALSQMGKTRFAKRAFETAVRHAPDHQAALIALGNDARLEGYMTRAKAMFSRALHAGPDNFAARANVSIPPLERGDLDVALRTITAALARVPFNLTLLANYLLGLNYVSTLEPRQVRALHGTFERLMAVKFGTRRMPVKPKRRATYRVGVLSADFRRHSVSMFVEPLLSGLPSGSLSVYCYSAVAKGDSHTERLRDYNNTWRDVAELDTHALARTIQGDSLDVLIELGGHTAGSRLDVFAEPLAPLQVSYLGYPNTIGSPRLDARISDPICDPQHEALGEPQRGPLGDTLDARFGEPDGQVTDNVIMLESPFICFAPVDEEDRPAQRHEGAERSSDGAPFRFASFNNLSKIQPCVIAAWARVLLAVPNSVLALRSRLFRDEAVRHEFVSRFEREGVSSHQIDALDYVSAHSERLAVYDAVDLALDTFPYNGTTTTCEALACGVPVLAVRGASHVARVGASLLTSAGLDVELVAQTVDEYVASAVRLATNPGQLQAVRTRLRQPGQLDRLRNADAHAKRFSQLIREQVDRQRAESVPLSHLLVVAMPDCGSAPLVDVFREMLPGVHVECVPYLSDAHEELLRAGVARVVALTRDPRDCAAGPGPWRAGQDPARIAAEYIQHVLAARQLYDRSECWLLEVVQLALAPRMELLALANWLGCDVDSIALASGELKVAGLISQLCVPLDGWSSRLSAPLVREIEHRWLAAAPAHTLRVETQNVVALSARLGCGGWISLPRSIASTSTAHMLVFGDVLADHRRRFVELMGDYGHFADLNAGQGEWLNGVAELLDSNGIAEGLELFLPSATLAQRSALAPRMAQVHVEWNSQQISRVTWLALQVERGAMAFAADAAAGVLAPDLASALAEGVIANDWVVVIRGLDGTGRDALSALGLVCISFAPHQQQFFVLPPGHADSALFVISPIRAERMNVRAAPQLRTSDCDYPSQHPDKSVFHTLSNAWRAEGLGIGSEALRLLAPVTDAVLSGQILDCREPSSGIRRLLEEWTPTWALSEGPLRSEAVVVAALLTHIRLSGWPEPEALKNLAKAISDQNEQPNGPLGECMARFLSIAEKSADGARKAIHPDAWSMEARLAFPILAEDGELAAND